MAAPKKGQDEAVETQNYLLIIAITTSATAGRPVLLHISIQKASYKLELSPFRLNECRYNDACSYLITGLMSSLALI